MVVTGCGSEPVADESGEFAGTTVVNGDGAYLADLVRGFSSAPSRFPDIKHFEEVSKAPSDPSRATSVAVATVVGVERGTAQSWGDDEDNPDAGREVAFASTDADTKTIHLTVEVREVLFGDLTEETISVGLALLAEADFDRVRNDLLGLGTVVLPIYRGSPVFDYEDDLYAIRRDGSLLLVVDEAEGLSAPFFGGDADQLLVNVPTLERLRAQLHEAA